MTESSLSERLRSYREKQGISQETLAGWLGVSRSTLAQYESGEKQPGVSVLENMAYRLGCDVESMLFSPGGIDPTIVLLRADPGLRENEEAQDCIRRCVRIGKEVSWLEEMLGVPRAAESLPGYRIQPPSSRIDAVRQGERAAAHERQRLGLGSSSIGNVISVLEDSGICASIVPLSNEISGVSIMEGGGFHVFVNMNHPSTRRRFSLAHEYAHVLLDLQKDSKIVVSCSTDAPTLREVRANAFAAAFLAPEEGCLSFIRSAGKGRPSRVEYTTFNGDDTVEANERNKTVEQSIQVYDILLLAGHFGISPEAAAYRLSNIHLLSEKDRDNFINGLKNGSHRGLSALFKTPSLCEGGEGSNFRDRLLGLALEAYRRGSITTGRLIEIAALADMDREHVEDALSGLDPIG